MKLLAHFRGEFAGWDDRRRRGLLGELLPLMNREISEYVGRALVLPHSWRNTSEDRRERLRDPYYGCFAFCLQSITSYAAELSTKVNVVVASHPEFSGYARLAQVTMVPPLLHTNTDAPIVDRPGCSNTMSGSVPASSRMRLPKRRHSAGSWV